jgi:hypothetical protein
VLKAPTPGIEEPSMARTKHRATSTIPDFPDKEQMTRARLMRRAFLVLLFVFIVLGLTGFFGVRSRTVTRTGGGYQVTVEYAQVTRPGLSTPWSVRIVRDGGFGGRPVNVAVSQDYLSMFDENGLDPDPVESTTDGEFVIWRFASPRGDTMVIEFDALLEPAQQWGKGGEVRILENDVPVVEVPFHTWVSP